MFVGAIVCCFHEASGQRAMPMPVESSKEGGYTCSTHRSRHSVLKFVVVPNMRSALRCLHTTIEHIPGSNPIELLQRLHTRGLVNDNSAGFSDHLLRKRTVYAGFDPTAETLHIGSLSLLATMCMFAKHGHEVIALIGGATALVGDPSGRSSGRKQLSSLQVEENSKGIAEVIKRVVGRYSGSVRIVNNADWMSKLSLLDFLRNTGNHFRVRMRRDFWIAIVGITPDDTLAGWNVAVPGFCEK